jgi:uncharacterized protein
MKKVFLTAEWRRLLMANYAVEPSVLQSYLPAHTELDMWNGKCYVSLVGFLFKNTRVKGFKMPFHVNFEEVNLRFYVKRFDPSVGWKRGVVFIKEIVPKTAIAWVANTLYRENYAAKPMKYTWQEQKDTLKVEYTWKTKGNWYTMKAKAQNVSADLIPDSEEEFITEHYWGYAHWDADKTIEYQVEHPRWQVYPVLEYAINLDFEKEYGQKLGFLNHEKPSSVFLAEGSEVKVREGTGLFN